MIRRPPRSTLVPCATLFRSTPASACPVPHPTRCRAERCRCLLCGPRDGLVERCPVAGGGADRKSTRLNSSHAHISYAVFCLEKTIDTSAAHLERRVHETFGQ